VSDGVPAMTSVGDVGLHRRAGRRARSLRARATRTPRARARAPRDRARCIAARRRIAAAFAESAPLVARANRRKTTRDELAVEPRGDRPDRRTRSRARRRRCGSRTRDPSKSPSFLAGRWNRAGHRRAARGHTPRRLGRGCGSRCMCRRRWQIGPTCGAVRRRRARSTPPICPDQSRAARGDRWRLGSPASVPSSAICSIPLRRSPRLYDLNRPRRACSASACCAPPRCPTSGGLVPETCRASRAPGPAARRRRVAARHRWRARLLRCARSPRRGAGSDRRPRGSHAICGSSRSTARGRPTR